MYPQYMCILLYVKLIWCSGIPYIYCSLGEACRYMYSQYMCYCAVCRQLFGVMVFHTGLWSIGALKGGTCILSICVFCHM